MSDLIPPTQFSRLETRDTTSVMTTFYAARQDYENGKGGRAVLFVLSTDLDTGTVKAKVLFVIDLGKKESVRDYVQSRIAEVVSDETLPGRPDFAEIDPGNYVGDFAFIGQMLEIQ